MADNLIAEVVLEEEQLCVVYDSKRNKISSRTLTKSETLLGHSKNIIVIEEALLGSPASLITIYDSSFNELCRGHLVGHEEIVSITDTGINTADYRPADPDLYHYDLKWRRTSVY